MQIIAIGGGGFTHGRDPEVDAYLLAQARSTRPRIGFVGTASGDSDRYLTMFYAEFTKHECRPSHVPLFQRTPDLRETVKALDIVFVGGGNTRSMLAVWREWGLAECLAEAARAGTVLAGTSAGAICWFESGITDSSAAGLEPLPCLGWLAGSCCPHYDGEAARRPSYQRLVAAGEVAGGVALDDGVALHYAEGELLRGVTSRPEAGAYRVSPGDGGATETRLSVERLG